MSRTLLPTIYLLSGLLLRTGTSTAQDAPRPVDRKQSKEILETRQLAKAKFEAMQADPAEVAGERLSAAWLEYEARRKEHLAGRGTLDFLLAAGKAVAQAELSVSANPAEHAGSLKWLWEQGWAIEMLNKARYDSGRIPIQDYAQSQLDRLDAQIRYFRSPAVMANEPPRYLAVERPYVSELVAVAKYDRLMHVRRWAQHQFEAHQATLEDFHRAKRAAALAQFEARFKEFEAGRGTLDFLLEAAVALREVEVALSNRKEDQLAADEQFWEAAYMTERVNRARYEAGRIPVQDYAASRYQRFDAALRLQHDLPAGAAADGSTAAVGAVWLLSRERRCGSEGPAAPTVASRAERRQYAQARFDDWQAAPETLARQRLDAAQQEQDSRMKEFLAGRGTLDFLLDVLQRRLRAELALKVEPSVAWERYWTELYGIETVNQGLYRDGRIPIQDIAQSRFHRLSAALEWSKVRPAAR